MQRALTALLLLAGLALLAWRSAAHVRLIHPSNGNPIHWQSPEAIPLVIQSGGSDDLPPGGHELAMAAAVDAWNALSGTRARLVLDETPAQKARTDWADSSLHLVLFDETNASGFFPSGSSVVAVTPIFFFSSGRIADADILFNGKKYQFTTSGAPGRFDVQDLLTHELGHLLGLDHSGWAGSSLYPYVDPTILLHRSLALDELRGMRDAYPDGAHPSITGILRRSSDDSLVQGAHVVARDAAGRTTAGALSDNSGLFRLAGLDAGIHTVYATPLDHPVSALNLGQGHVVQTDFEARVLGQVAVAGSGEHAMGTLTLDAPVAVSLGRIADDYPLRAPHGAASSHVVRGAGLVAGSTLEASDPTVELDQITWTGGAVHFRASVPAGAAPGHVDLTVTDPGGARSILAAALEITPPDPLVDVVSPASGPMAGGTTVTIHGAHFEPGLRVVLGDNVYLEGEADGVALVDAQTLRLATRATAGGLHDVIVIDRTGVEGRLSDGFRATGIPVVSSVFPTAGSAAGGTRVTIAGADFITGASVWIEGVLQPQASVLGTGHLELTTAGGLPGGPYTLTVVNPGGATATSAFSYASGPDPSVAALDPASGSVSGGDTVTFHGSGFTPNTEVVFGADPLTGSGGAPAQQVVFVDQATLRVTTPSLGSGAKSVLVRNLATEQASLATDAFTYEGGSGGGGGGGGGCHAGLDTGAGARDALAFLAWALLAVLLARLGAPGAARRRAQPAGVRPRRRVVPVAAPKRLLPEPATGRGD